MAQNTHLLSLQTKKVNKNGGQWWGTNTSHCATNIYRKACDRCPTSLGEQAQSDGFAIPPVACTENLAAGLAASLAAGFAQCWATRLIWGLAAGFLGP